MITETLKHNNLTEKPLGGSDASLHHQYGLPSVMWPTILQALSIQLLADVIE